MYIYSRYTPTGVYAQDDAPGKDDPRDDMRREIAASGGDLSCLELTAQIGQGAFAAVYRGGWVASAASLFVPCVCEGGGACFVEGGSW